MYHPPSLRQRSPRSRNRPARCGPSHGLRPTGSQYPQDPGDGPAYRREARILENDGGELRLFARKLGDYHRDDLKASFLSAIGRGWVEREEAIRLLARWLGFARNGQRDEVGGEEFDEWVGEGRGGWKWRGGGW